MSTPHLAAVTTDTYVVEIEGPNPDGLYIGNLYLNKSYVRTICREDRAAVLVEAQRWAAYEREREATRETVTL